MNAPARTAESTALAHLQPAPMLMGRDLILQSQNFDAMIRVSDLMANSGQAVPRHLRKNPGACFAVTLQAMRWNIDPFALGQQSYTADDSGPISYQGQAIIAALNNSPLLATRLQFEWGGPWEKIIGRFVWKESTKKTDDNGKPKKYLAKAWDDNEEEGLWCKVSALLVGEREPRTLQLFLMQARVRNSPLWVEDPRQQLAYLAGRRWGRLYAPDVIMGVFTPDELPGPDERFMGMADVVGAPPPPPPAPALPAYAADAFNKNLPAWTKLIQSGKKTANDVIATLETKATLSDEQRAAINALAKVEDAKPRMTYAQVADALNAAQDADALSTAALGIEAVADEQQRAELTAIYERRSAELPF
jgi:hypothetical protein